jgi:hypothetical protein
VLSEIPVDLAFESGAPGPLALVPLLQGGEAPENAFEALVTGKPSPHKRSRTSRPSRGARRSVSTRKGR